MMRSLSLLLLHALSVHSEWLSAHGNPQQSSTSLGLGPGASFSSWTYRTSATLPQPPPTSVGFSPLFDSGSVYIFDYSGAGSLSRLHTSTGALLFRVSLNSSSPVTNGGMALVPSPLNHSAVGLVAVVTPGGTLCALDALTGWPVWQASTQQSLVMSAPAVSGLHVFVRLNDGSTRAFSSSSGAELWSTPCGLFPSNNVVLSQMAVTLASPLAASAACSSAALCATLFTASLTPTPTVLALAASTGAVLWGAPLAPELTPTTELVAGGGRLFFGCAVGVAALNATDGALLWQRTPTGQPDTGLVTGAPVYSEALGLLLLSQLLSGLFALQAHTGSNAWFSPYSYAAVSPALDAAGVLYCVAVDGNVGAFAAQNGSLLASSVAPSALGASAPALSGRGHLALYSSTTATLTLLGQGLPAPPLPPPPQPPSGAGSAGTGGGTPLPPALTTALSAAAGLLLGGGLLAGAAWRCWRKGLGAQSLTGGRAAAVAPRQQRSAATSMEEEWGLLEASYSASTVEVGGGSSSSSSSNSSSRGGTFTAAAAAAASAMPSALEPLLQERGQEAGREGPQLQLQLQLQGASASSGHGGGGSSAASVATGSSSSSSSSSKRGAEVEGGVGSAAAALPAQSLQLQQAEAEAANLVVQAGGELLPEEWSEALHTEPSFSTSVVVCEGAKGEGLGFMATAPQLLEMEGDSFVIGPEGLQ